MLYNRMQLMKVARSRLDSVYYTITMTKSSFRWPVNTSLRIGVLEAQGGALWVWSGPSCLVKLPAHCAVMMNILGFRSRTPCS